MGHSQANKAASRERILGEAAAQLRTSGIAGLTIAALMDRAGLTHGGFYKHFASRDGLVAAALERALVDRFARPAAGPPGSRADVAGLIRGYLSRTHRDAGPAACAISALAGEVGRESPELKAVMAPHVEAFLDGVASATGRDDRAALIVSALVGAVALARVLPAARSDALLRSVREQLLALTEGAPEGEAPARAT